MPADARPTGEPGDDSADGGSVWGPARLADGSVVDVVPMTGAHEPALVRFHAHLSTRTTRARFFTVHPILTEEESYRFTHVDHADREALVAEVDGEIVAVARLDRTTPGGDEAEVAFVVRDDWQGRGLGTLLMARLGARARQLGLRRLVAETFVDNRRMRAVFRRAGAREVGSDGGVVWIAVDLPSDPS